VGNGPRGKEEVGTLKEEREKREKRREKKEERVQEDYCLG
jgi:hypothetical protein